MANVRDILRHKGHDILSITPRATVFDAAERMNERRVGALLVLDDERLIGLVSERDIMQRVVAQRLDPAVTLVEEVMTTDLICCEPQTSLEEARSAMKNRRVRHLPVLESNGKLVGLVSIGDLNAHHADTQERTIHLLESYIQGQT